MSTVVIDSSLLSLSVCVRLGSTPGSSFGPGIPLKKFHIDQRSTARGRARKNFRTFTVRVGSTFVLSYIQYIHFFFLVFMMSYDTSITKVRKYFVLPYNTYIRNITYCTEVRRYFISYESTKVQSTFVRKYFRTTSIPSYIRKYYYCKVKQLRRYCMYYFRTFIDRIPSYEGNNHTTVQYVYNVACRP